MLDVSDRDNRLQLASKVGDEAQAWKFTPRERSTLPEQYR